MPGLSEWELSAIVLRFNQKTLKISDAYGDGGVDPLWPRFERAAGNQISEGDVTLPR